MVRTKAFAFLLTALIGTLPSPAQTTSPTTSLPLTLSAGHDTDPQDHGRPVILIAAALGIPTDVFRDAFSRVKPAPAGQEPDPQQVQLNKQALLTALSKYNITNDKLDQVSDTYRYPPGDAKLWKHTDAIIKATLTDGKITGFLIQNPGSGYTSPPKISLPGFPNLQAKITLHFTTDLPKNGSIESIRLLTPPTTKP